METLNEIKAELLAVLTASTFNVRDGLTALADVELFCQGNDDRVTVGTYTFSLKTLHNLAIDGLCARLEGTVKARCNACYSYIEGLLN